MNPHRRHPLDLGPGRHPNRGQLLFAAVMSALSAVLWAWITGIPMVAWLTFGYNMIHAYVTPEARETKAGRVLGSLVSGAFAALAGMLGVKWHVMPGGR